MQKRLPRFAMFVLLAIGACVNTGGKTSGASGNKPAQEASNGPDGKELLALLEGKWQSETDATYQLVVTNDSIQHLNDGKPSATSALEIDVNCQNVACKTDSINTSDGWCFLEKGQFDIQCNLILQEDATRLEYRALGAATGALVFRKIN